MRTWTDGEIGEQRQRVNNSPPNRIFYEWGRLDCMTGRVVSPRSATSMETLQWETGWAHEMGGVERPYDVPHDIAIG